MSGRWYRAIYIYIVAASCVATGVWLAARADAVAIAYPTRGLRLLAFGVVSGIVGLGLAGATWARARHASQDRRRP